VNDVTFLLGTDIGTLGTKSVLVDTEGQIHANAFREYDVITPKQGWAVQWPQVWAEAAYHTIGETLRKSGIDPADVAGVSISSLYGGSGIPLDREMEPIRPCIIWADRRATHECASVKENIGEDHLYDVTGNVIDPYYGYTKMLWIRENEPKTWDKLYRFETPNAYCIRQLTGKENIDYSSAGNYGGLFDLKKRTWSEPLMEELGIPRNLFPEQLYSSDEVVAEVTTKGSELSGLKVGTPICAGGIDAPVSALAGGALQDGDLSSMLGTSMCNGFISHTPRLSPQMINYPYVVKGREYLYSFTGIATAGFCVRWFRDQFGAQEMRLQRETAIGAYEQLDDQAASIPPGSDDLLFMPHMMVGERAPYWSETIRGGFLGLTIYHTRLHLFRAILEGVAYAMRYSIEAATQTGFKINNATLVDGGARSPLWRQIIADITGVNMSYIPNAGGAPIGDAILAGLGTGEISDPKVIDEWLGEKIPMVPDEETSLKYEHYYKLYKMSLEHVSPIYRYFPS
jgi:xylulokinase